MPTENQSDFCVWKVHDSEYNDRYETACKEPYSFMYGGPVENLYRYCPGCGKRIKVEVRIEPL